MDETEGLPVPPSVLLVADDETLRTTWTQALKETQARLVFARSSERALELYQTEAFLLVAADLDLADGGAADLIGQIRELGPQQAILAVADDPSPATLILLIKAAVRDFFRKEDSAQGLRNTLRSELQSDRRKNLSPSYPLRLEKELEIRTSELQDAMIKIQKLQETKESMLILISHELRTPLNGILGFTDLARSQVEDPQVLSFLTMIRESAVRLERSTKKALEFVRLSSGSRVPQKMTHPVEKLISTAFHELGRRFKDQAWELVQKVAPDAVLFTDGELALEVLMNILENAMKYAGNSGILRASHRREGVWDIVEIKDSGPGFSEKALSRSFEPFTSGHPMNHMEGMGLGLALTDLIMLSLGGRVKLQNNVDGGARVRLYFPRR